HSDILMLGAFSAFYLSPTVEKLMGPRTPMGALLVVILAAAICAMIGALIEFFAYRPLRNRPRLTVLITAIGVSLFIEFTCQNKLVFGSNPRPFPTLVNDKQIHMGG